MLNQAKKRGLILLVVLGMLSLFSLLAVTYVVFAGQARTASLQHARRDFRGTPPDRLLDQAIKQVIRGTNDTDSSLWRQSLLDDLYGAIEQPISVKARDSQFDVSNRTLPPGLVTLPIPAGSSYGPKLYEPFVSNGQTFGPFLKIPLEWNQDLPLHHDALTGRVLTFRAGPLANQSFNIIRYVGRIEDADLMTLGEIQFCVLIDISSADDARTAVAHTAPASAKAYNLTEWLDDDPSNEGASLLYQVYPPNSNAGGRLRSPYSMLINAGVQNSPGIGISKTNNTVTPQITTAFRINAKAQANLLAPFDQIPDSLLPHFAYTYLVTRYGQTYTPQGDTDEPYDAADYNNFFMSLRRSATTLTSDEITPAFHRPEVINYLAGLDSGNLSLASMTPDTFLSFLEVMQRATARPLSFRIENFPSTGAMYRSNTHFTGGSRFEVIGQARTPQLQFDWDARTSSNLPQEAFDAWLRWQLRGSWDVDNDSDGVKDSVWVDLNYPLSTAPDGKLLKLLAAFYIEDMDGKIDLNAAGSQIQASDSTYPLNLSNARYAYMQNYPSPQDWPQGLGFGPADIYLRHLFDDQQHHSDVMTLRYSDKPGEDNVDDPISKILAHQSISTGMRPSRPSYSRLPGLPVSTHGRLGIALDLLGNPILVDTTSNVLEEETDDPYESQPLSGFHRDAGISFSDWERLVRFNAVDRSSLSSKLEREANTSWQMFNGGTVNASFLPRIRSISPRNVSLSLPRFARSYSTTTGTRRVSSFVEFVEEYAQRRTSNQSYPVVSNAAIAQLFPLEFAHNQPLNLNRPFGNGNDDNNDGSVDDPKEIASFFPNTESEAYDTSSTPGNYNRNAMEFDPGYDPRSTTASTLTTAQWRPHSGNQSRQLFARHLYCLAQLILPVDTGNKNAYIFPNQPTTATPVDNETRARILAQWAVNVVDFRDADAAMTRFVYDPDPFYNSNTFSPSWTPDPTHVVFGFEQPELLLTESFATHDIRVKKRPPPAMDEYDQIRIPEGSLFLEFFCPRSTATNQVTDDLLPGLPLSLYGQPGGNSNNPYALDLTRTISDGTNEFPVWRVLLTKPSVTTGGTPTIEVEAFTKAFESNTPGNTNKAEIGLRSFNYSYQIGNSDSGLKWRVASTPTDVENTSDPQPIVEPVIDRILWFTNTLTPTATNVAVPTNVPNPEKRVFYHRAGAMPFLQGGQYLVVGPRPTTYFGSKTQTGLPRLHQPNNHRIEIQNNWIQMWQQDNNPALWISNTPPAPLPNNTPKPALANNLRSCLGMVAGANMPDVALWPQDNEITQTYIGLNISEPTPDKYYPQPTVKVNSTNAQADTENGAPGYEKLSKDGYVDLGGSTANGQKSVFDRGAGGADSKFFLEEHAWPQDSMGSYPKPQTQRNWSAAVLQRLADPARVWHAVLNPYITVDWHSVDLTVFSGEDTLAEEGDFYFASRAKSGAHRKVQVTDPPASTDGLTLGNQGETFYSYETSFPTLQQKSQDAAGNVFFKKELLSEYYANQAAASPGQTRGQTGEFVSFGYLNRNFTLRGTSNEYYWAYYTGVPTRTPDAPFFPNRDFVNALELCNVPLSSPGNFMQDFYFEPVNQNQPVPRSRHTLDFEQILGTAVKTAGELFDLVSVPSPWIDSWNVVNPARVAYNSSDIPRSTLLGPYEAPLNLIPTYREPGRVNLNTAMEPNVMRALMGNIMPNADRKNMATTTPYAAELQASIQGGLTRSSVLDSRSPTSGNPYLSSQSPTQFPGVFTSMSGRDLFPIAGLQKQNPVDSMLLRRSGNQRVLNSSLIPAFASTPINNTFIDNYPAARLMNLTTDRSNVFKVHITLAYFEYDAQTGLGIEYGTEQGQSDRFRGFYLIDRSIPVGFSSGTDLNATDCILVRRIIE